MLSIFSFFGTDLVANPPVAVALNATSAGGLLYSIQVEAVESDITLPLQLVNVTVDWNDGQPSVVFPYALTSNGTNTVDAGRVLGLGQHIINVQAQNLRAPQADIIAVNFDVTVLPSVEFATVTPLLFGPILPRDDGYPNPQQWDFNTGYDTAIIDSSVKMLLSTSKGERIMLPDYGTNLRLLVFGPVTQDMQATAQQEIIDALNNWEPRASLQSLTVTQTASAAITLTCILLSKLTQQTFTTTVVFAP
jgi:phage baseplate assembly protein W